LGKRLRNLHTPLASDRDRDAEEGAVALAVDPLDLVLVAWLGLLQRTTRGRSDFLYSRPACILNPGWE